MDQWLGRDLRGHGGTIAIAPGAGSTVADMTFTTTSGIYNFDADTAAEGLTLLDGPIMDNSGSSTQLRFALDTIITMANAETLTVKPGVGGINFANGTNGARNDTFAVNGALLVASSSGAICGTNNDVGQFAEVTLGGGNTFHQQRNSGGSANFANGWEQGTDGQWFWSNGPPPRENRQNEQPEIPARRNGSATCAAGWEARIQTGALPAVGWSVLLAFDFAEPPKVILDSRCIARLACDT